MRSRTAHELWHSGACLFALTPDACFLFLADERRRRSFAKFWTHSLILPAFTVKVKKVEKKVQIFVNIFINV